MTCRSSAPAAPAATVVLLRDHAGALEALLLRRNARLAFHGGSWVFPGGRIDPEDFAGGGAEDVDRAARRAAVREAWEEAGLTVAAADLVELSHWTTPRGQPKRFATWFYLAPVTGRESEVSVDGGEIHDHRWVRPGHALELQRAGEIALPPPTYVSLLALGAFADTRTALGAYRDRPPEIFEPRLHAVPGGRCALYAGDRGYAAGELDAPGSRHRLWMVEGGWRYERDV